MCEFSAESLGRVVVAGAGVSGAGCARLLARVGADVRVADDNETARFRVQEATGVEAWSTAQLRESLDSVDLVVTSPGWRPDSAVLVAAAEAGVEVIGDVELAWRLDSAGACGAPRTWLAITGTNGKTTTTAMAAAMLSEGGFKAEAVGNIGVSVSDALLAEPRIDVIVAELSSFQLHWSSTIHPAAGVLLNLADDHIDWHGSFDAYALAKAKLLDSDVAIISRDDAAVVRVAGARDVIAFGSGIPVDGELGVEDGMLVDRAFGGGVLASAEGISPAGPAGVYDALAAAALARSQGVEPQAIARALDTFEVSGHRGQVVHEHNGVAFVDNSKATNPHAADAALRGQSGVHWVAGGQLKGADVAELVREHAPHMAAAYLMGVDREVMRQALLDARPDLPIVVTDSTDPVAATEELVAAAAAAAQPGQSVVLAPAAASLDMFTGMGQRGDLFADAARRFAR